MPACKCHVDRPLAAASLPPALAQPSLTPCSPQVIIALLWRMLPVLLTRWEQAWGAETAAVLYQAPHIMLELVVLQPLLQVRCLAFVAMRLHRFCPPLWCACWEARPLWDALAWARLAWQLLLQARWPSLAVARGTVLKLAALQPLREARCLR